MRILNIPLDRIPTAPPPTRRMATLAMMAALAIALLMPSAARAAGAFSNKNAFAAAIPGGVAAADFESLAIGASVSGTTQTVAGAGAGVVLPAPIPDVLDSGGPALMLQIVGDPVNNPASSGSRSLGVADPGNFDAITAGSSLVFTSTTPVIAFGLTVITPEEPGTALLDGDLRLRVPGQATAQLTLADGQSLGIHGAREYRAYFLGVIGASTFTTATLELSSSVEPSSFFFNVDDLVVPLPEPDQTSLLLAGAALLWTRAHMRLTRKGSS